MTPRRESRAGFTERVRATAVRAALKELDERRQESDRQVRDELTGLQRRLIYAVLLTVSVFMLGVVGYHIIGGPDYSWLDAVYMTAITLTTTGFREVIDVSHHTGGRIFTIFLLVFGAGTVVYFTSVVIAFVVEGDLTQGFRRRRMQRAIQEMSEHYIVCGAGATGVAVIRELTTTGREAVLVESDEEAARRVTDQLPTVPVVIGDFTDDETLIRAGIGRAMGIVMCVTSEKDTLVATITARQLNPRARVVVRAANERAGARLHNAGADAVVSPALIGGMRMASELIRPSVVNFLDQMLRDKDRNLRIEEVEIPRGSPFVDRTVAELDVSQIDGLLLLAIQDAGAEGEYVYNPPREHRLAEGAQLIVMGDTRGMRTLRRRIEGDTRGAAAPA